MTMYRRAHPCISQLKADIFFEFIDEFLSGGCFNNLIEVMASKLTSQSEYSTVDDLSNASYFFTIAWFLNYQREQIMLNNTASFDFGSVRQH